MDSIVLIYFKCLKLELYYEPSILCSINLPKSHVSLISCNTKEVFLE
jgi:hypothetical protein